MLTIPSERLPTWIINRTWHQTKNGDLDIAQTESSKEVWWSCPRGEDHEWQATINDRFYNQRRCPCCAGLKLSVTNSLAAVRPEIAAQLHKTKNGGIQADQILSRSNDLFWWKCLKGPDHEWKATVASRTSTILSDDDCPSCCADNLPVTIYSPSYSPIYTPSPTYSASTYSASPTYSDSPTYSTSPTFAHSPTNSRANNISPFVSRDSEFYRFCVSQPQVSPVYNRYPVNYKNPSRRRTCCNSGFCRYIHDRWVCWCYLYAGEGPLEPAEDVEPDEPMWIQEKTAFDIGATELDPELIESAGGNSAHANGESRSRPEPTTSKTAETEEFKSDGNGGECPDQTRSRPEPTTSNSTKTEELESDGNGGGSPDQTRPEWGENQWSNQLRKTKNDNESASRARQRTEPVIEHSGDDSEDVGSKVSDAAVTTIDSAVDSAVSSSQANKASIVDSRTDAGSTNIDRKRPMDTSKSSPKKKRFKNLS